MKDKIDEGSIVFDKRQNREVKVWAIYCVDETLKKIPESKKLVVSHVGFKGILPVDKNCKLIKP
jgi:hypothetical protein